jgi:SP family sugar:H+ symporter-like MFS transporter
MSEQGTVAGTAEDWGAIERFEPGESHGAVTRAAATAALGGFLFGYDSAVINGAVTAIGNRFNTSAGVLGFAVSSALIGAAAGAFTAGSIADRFGRLKAMWVAAALFLLSAIGTGLSGSLGLLIGFRVIGGVAVGAASVIAPAYIAEIAPARIRGRLGSLQQLAIVTGIFWRCSSTTSSPPRRAARRRTCGSGSRPGAGCSCRWPSRRCSMAAWR